MKIFRKGVVSFCNNRERVPKASNTIFKIELLVCISFFISCTNGSAQEIKKYVQSNTYKVNTIVPDSIEYADLEAIGKAIGEAHVVMLGEQDHGDGPTFLAKTRLIKYLHEKKGFNVLAFESDFYSLTKGWDKVSKQPDSIYRFLKENLYPYWGRTTECRYLIQGYIPNSFRTEKPLNVAGFDPQVALDYSYNNLSKELDKYCQESQLIDRFSSDSAYRKFILAMKDLTASGRKPGSFTADMYYDLKVGIEVFQKNTIEKNKESAYWDQVIKNIAAFSNNGNEVRDKLMSDNFYYLLNQKYNGEKIIVWAANTHIMKYTNHLKSNRRNFDKVIFQNMGTNLTERYLLSNMYVIGFASYRGTAGRLFTNTFPIEGPNKNGLENWVPEDIDYGFIDFKNYNSNFNNPSKAFLMKSPMHSTIPKNVVSIPWNLVYDGIFFIREMYPATIVKD